MDLHQLPDGDEVANSSMFLAYRTLTLKNINFFLENRTLFEDHDIKNQVEHEGNVRVLLDREKNRIRNLYNLVSHQSQGDEEYQLKTAVGTIFFLSLLEQNFWFEEHSHDSWSEEKSLIARIIHHMLGVAKVKSLHSSSLINKPESKSHSEVQSPDP